jgi:hypothetical protein
MMPRRNSPTVPREVIPVTTYEQLNRYLVKFSAEELGLGLVLLLGRHGTGKSESVKLALSVNDLANDNSLRPGRSPLYIEGHIVNSGSAATNRSSLMISPTLRRS